MASHTTRLAHKVMKELRVGGQILELHRARKIYRCCECSLPIEPGEQYYCRYIGGAGLGNIKFPDRLHIRCFDQTKGGKSDTGNKSTSQ